MRKFRKLNFVYLFVFIFILCFENAAAQQQIASVMHTRHTIESKVLGEERTILIRVPPTYERSAEKFPVLLMLDAHAPQNAMMASIIESQADAGAIPEMILVGIQNTNRVRDLTPTRTDRTGSGGGDKFLDFIETELLPFVDKNYRTEPYRVFAGHSLGGMAVVYAMATRPHLFSGYIAASPFLHWDGNHVIKKAEERLRSEKEFRKSLFFTLGSEPPYMGGFNAFKDVLKKNSPDGFQYEVEHWTDEDHGSILMRTYLAGVRETFNGWRIDATVQTFPALKAHYSRLSKRFGYTVKPPENIVNQFGYVLLRENRIDAAVEAFEENVNLYPESANVYDSLAEALERKGSRSKALANYEKAYKMAEQKGEARLAESAKANFDRLKNVN